jgi:hypothetical protein
MSELKVTSLESNNSLTANVITVGQTTVNSTGIYFPNSDSGINSSAISISSDTSEQFNILTPSISTTTITVSNVEYSSLITETVNTQIFTANGVWVKPDWANTGNELVITHLWGGGGGSAANGAGGGGGAYVFGYFKGSQVDATCDVEVGIGGTGGTTATAGGTSVFYANTTNALSAYGGGGGADASNVVGRGGGWLSAGNTTVGGAPLGGNATIKDSTFGGGGDNANSIYGGGGGGRATAAGSSIFGGGGGCNSAALGTSVYGGNGGNSTISATAPGGGAGGLANNGARGEVRVYTLSNFSRFTPSLGATYQEGIYIGRIDVDGVLYGVLLAPKALGQSSPPLAWKTSATVTPGTSSVYDGLTNSNNMFNEEHPAASFCRNLSIGGYTDWYLPSLNELQLVHNARDFLPVGETNDTGRHWTSTEVSDNQSYAIDLGNGNLSNRTKTETNRVRAVRRFLI